MAEAVEGKRISMKNMDAYPSRSVSTSSFEISKGYPDDDGHQRNVDVVVNQLHAADDVPEKRQKSCCIRFIGPILTLISVIIAIGGGIAVRHFYPDKKWTERELMYLGFPGEMFLRGLKCLILPLIIGSIISALGNLESAFAGKVGTRAALYYFLTTMLAIGLGILLVMTIQPGVAPSPDSSDNNVTSTLADKTDVPDSTTVSTLLHAPNPSAKINSVDSILDLIRNIVPTNLLEACTAHYTTNLHDDDQGHEIVSGKMTEGTNILGLICFSILLGVMCGKMGEAGKPITALFTCLSEASMKITRLVIFFTPLGVLFLVFPRIVEVEDVNQMLGSVGLYTATILIGLFVHGFVVLPIIFIILARKNPFKHLANMTSALLTALGTSSSSATLPVTINCLEKNLGYDSRVVRFLVPIGATVNMDGTALYEAVAAIFIAQTRGIPLTPVQVVIISITATAASIGAAGIPQAGLVTMVIVLNAVGLPAEDVYLIFVVDWFLDRFRTIINVLGDSYGCAVICSLCPSDVFEKEIQEVEMKRQSMKQSMNKSRSIDSFHSINNNPVNFGESIQMESRDSVVSGNDMRSNQDIEKQKRGSNGNTARMNGTLAATPV